MLQLMNIITSTVQDYFLDLFKLFQSYLTPCESNPSKLKRILSILKSSSRNITWAIPPEQVTHP